MAPGNGGHHYRLMKQVLKALHGSRLYRTNTEDSDYDWIGAHVRDKDYYLGVKSEFGLVAPEPDSDWTQHEIRKFVSMCLKFNPNVIVSLWSTNYEVTPHWEWLFKRRNLFISRKAITACLGFSTSQLHQAGNPGTTGQLGSKRKELIDKHGFDPKFAMHAIRISRMLEELMKTGQFNVVRKDADNLLKIRNGLVPLKEIREEHEGILRRVRSMETTSDLPESPDVLTINKLVIESMLVSI